MENKLPAADITLEYTRTLLDAKMPGRWEKYAENRYLLGLFL